MLGGSGKRRRSGAGKKRRSNVGPGCFSGSVSTECASSSFCGATAQEVGDTTIQDSSGNTRSLHPTPSVHGPRKTQRNKNGNLFRFTDYSHDFDEPLMSPSQGEKDPKWFRTPQRSGSVNTTKRSSRPCPTPVTSKKVLEVLEANRELANMGSAEDQASLLLPEVVQKVRDVCYNKGPPLQKETCRG